MVTRTPIKWNTANFAPDQNPFSNQSRIPFTWDDVALLTEVLEEIRGGKDSGDFYPHQVFKDEKKKKRFITLICKVKGYDIYKSTKEVKDVKITANDVKLVLKEGLGIDIKIEL